MAKAQGYKMKEQIAEHFVIRDFMVIEKCSECNGTGSKEIPHNRLVNRIITCPVCKGTKNGNTTKDLNWGDLNIKAILECVMVGSFVDLRNKALTTKNGGRIVRKNLK